MAYMITVYPQDNGKWTWWWNGREPKKQFDKKKDAVKSAKRAAKSHYRNKKRKKQAFPDGMPPEPIMLEIHYRGSTPPKTVNVPKNAGEK